MKNDILKKILKMHRIIIKSENKAFTLMEMIIVIGILMILTSFILATANPLAQFEKANDAQRKSDLSQIQKSLETYYQDNKSYPLSDANNQIKNASGVSVVWGNSWSPYMNTLPKDPNSSRKYVYYSTGQSYWLYASLERAAKDNQACHKDGSVCTGLSEIDLSTACSSVCNYGLSSPNVSP